MKIRTLILAFSILLGFQYSNAMDGSFKMPDASTLKDRLSKTGFSDFVEKTNIVENLAGQDKVALGVVMAVELATADYIEDLKKGMPAPMLNITRTQMQMHKPLIFEALLKDNPSALDELKELGIYSPAK